MKNLTDNAIEQTLEEIARVKGQRDDARQIIRNVAEFVTDRNKELARLERELKTLESPEELYRTAFGLRERDKLAIVEKSPLNLYGMEAV